MHRHELDAVSLVVALIFITIGGLFLSGRVDAIDFVSIWALPFSLVGAGLVLGAVAVTRHRRNRDVEPDVATEDLSLE